MVNQITTIITLVLVLVIGVVLINSVKDIITGATIGCEEVECKNNADCDDENDCTDDACMYPKSCESLCYHSIRKECLN